MSKKGDGAVRYTLLIEHDSSEGYIVSVNELPGVFASGSTETEAIRNIRQAIRIHLRLLRKHATHIIPRPKLVEVEI